MTAPSRTRAAVAGLALLAGAAAVVTSVLVFPYGSVNHDEAVYLQQAALLLEGRLFLHPPVPEAFRPWFFVRDGARLYPKYAPVPAAAFAAGQFLGDARLALGAVAAAAVALTYGVVAEAFDRRHGLLAAVLLVASPLFLVQSAVFLPYLPTAALDLLFAYGYLRADRTGSRGWAAVAGGAVGLAFFARPYTAVLFALPFVLHALWTLRGLDRSTVERHALTAVLGLAGVGVALVYNAVVTGSPLRFPYTAFAPRDGLGFGHRALVGHGVDYTPALAVRANAEVLWEFSARWFVAGPLGSALALLGLGVLVRSTRRRPGPGDPRRLLLVGVAVAVVTGNLFFWGNLNVLGALSEPADGLVHYLGPYYHVDLLLPAVALAAHGGLVLADGWRGALRRRLPSDRAGRAWVAGIVVAAAVGGGAAVAVAGEPVADNRAVTDRMADAYRPFEDRDLDQAVVFLPTPQGDWLNHPFQALRNDPGYDGRVLYAIEQRPFAVVEAFPDRTYYRYSYRGAWAPTAGESVTPQLRELQVVEGDEVQLRVTVRVPDGAESASFRLAGDEDVAYYVGNVTGEHQTVRLVVGSGEARLLGEVGPSRGGSVSVADAAQVTVEAFFERSDGGGVAYRVRLPVDVGPRVRAISPHVEACREPLRCGGEATYVSGATRPDVAIETALSAGEAA